MCLSQDTVESELAELRGQLRAHETGQDVRVATIKDMFKNDVKHQAADTLRYSSFPSRSFPVFVHMADHFVPADSRSTNRSRPRSKVKSRNRSTYRSRNTSLHPSHRRSRTAAGSSRTSAPRSRTRTSSPPVPPPCAPQTPSLVVRWTTLLTRWTRVGRRAARTGCSGRTRPISPTRSPSSSARTAPGARYTPLT